LKTILVLSFGPILSQLASSLFGFVDTYWVSKRLGTLGVSKVSTYASLDSMGRSFVFFQVAANTQISSMFGAGLGDQTEEMWWIL
jgi:Na+-driven multidrug efflux pump